MFFSLVPGGFLDLINQNNYNSNWKKILGFRNLQEKLEKVFSHSRSEQFLHSKLHKFYFVKTLKRFLRYVMLTEVGIHFMNGPVGYRVLLISHHFYTISGELYVHLCYSVLWPLWIRLKLVLEFNDWHQHYKFGIVRNLLLVLLPSVIQWNLELE